jgi:hypothetical protein
MRKQEPSDFQTFEKLKALGPSLRWDDERERAFDIPACDDRRTAVDTGSFARSEGTQLDRGQAG